jgi:hypothetical protein
LPKRFKLKLFSYEIRHIKRQAARSVARLVQVPVALLMGQHPRLGSDSPFLALDPDVLRLIVSLVP